MLHGAPRDAASAAPEAAVAAETASAGPPVIRSATLQQLVDVGGILEVPVVAERASPEGASETA